MSLDRDQTIGDYRLERMLGSGTFGEVWLGEEASSGDFHALKFSRGSTNVDIEKEMESWKKASGHPNVVRFLRSFKHGTNIVLVSEYVKDSSLRVRLDSKGRPPLAGAMRLMVDVIRGLDHLHSNRIIHRDLKPDNVLMEGDCPKIGDFGTARLINEHPGSITMVGTYAYMAPEMFRMGLHRETPCDVWSAGVMVYELASGRLPFTGNSTNEVIEAIRDGDPEPLPVDTPDALVRLIRWALTKNHAGSSRPTASELGYWLQDWVNQAPQHWEKTVLLPDANVALAQSANSDTPTSRIDATTKKKSSE